MRNVFITVFILVAGYATACTNFIVGKAASIDGSVICTYNADDYGMFQRLCHYPAAKKTGLKNEAIAKAKAAKAAEAEVNEARAKSIAAKKAEAEEAARKAAEEAAAEAAAEPVETPAE